MTDMIERVARAIAESLGVDPDDTVNFPDRTTVMWKEFVPQARAAIEAMKRNPETTPKGIPVLVDGGVAMKKTGGEWFTGMEEPMFQRPLQWEPTFWIPLDAFNEPLRQDSPAPTVEE